MRGGLLFGLVVGWVGRVVDRCAVLDPGAAIEVERTVNAVGHIGLGGMRLSIGAALAGRRVTLRLDGTVMHVLDVDRTLLATRPCPIPTAKLARLQGAHPAGPRPRPHRPGR